MRAVGIGSGVTLLALFAVLAAAAALGDFSTAVLVAGALVAIAAGLAGPKWWIDASLRPVARRRGESLPSASWKLAVAGPLTQAVYLAALVSVTFLRSVDWRGITYECDSFRGS